MLTLLPVSDRSVVARQHHVQDDQVRLARRQCGAQALATATRAEMEKRAKEKGITLPEHHSPLAGMGGNGAAASEYAH